VAESIAFSREGLVDREVRYRELVAGLRALLEGETDLIAALANASAALDEGIAAASWVGFYRRVGEELVLGPFQGQVACVRIAMGRGVCGSAAAERRTIVVPDVEAFPGHIACDAGSRSEIVVPIVQGERVVAVLDVDSHDLAAFDEVDARWLGEVAVLLAGLAW
jgi:L-methionine (R)-S-oxide reductase